MAVPVYFRYGSDPESLMIDHIFSAVRKAKTLGVAILDEKGLRSLLAQAT